MYVYIYIYIYIYIYKVILTYARQCSIHRSRAMYILWEEKDIIRQKRHFLIEKKRYTYFAIFSNCNNFKNRCIININIYNYIYIKSNFDIYIYIYIYIYTLT